MIKREAISQLVSAGKACGIETSLYDSDVTEVGIGCFSMEMGDRKLEMPIMAEIAANKKGRVYLRVAISVYDCSDENSALHISTIRCNRKTSSSILKGNSPVLNVFEAVPEVEKAIQKVLPDFTNVVNQAYTSYEQKIMNSNTKADISAKPKRRI